MEPLGLLSVRDYIHTTLTAYGLVEDHPFKGADSSGKNLILKLLGKHPELAPVLVGAHYDRLIGAYQGKIRRRQAWQEAQEGRTGEPELGIHPTGSGRPGLWRSSGVVV